MEAQAPDVVHVHEPEDGRESEESDEEVLGGDPPPVAAQESSNESTDDENNAQQPLGSERYDFSTSAGRVAEPNIDIPQSYLGKSKHLFETIIQKYTETRERRQEIDNLLKGFKQRLQLDEKAELPTCFTRLRSLVGDYEYLQLSRDDPLCIIVGEDADEVAQEAIVKFNLMLERCAEFPVEKDAAMTLIQEKIEALEKERQIQATQDALQQSKVYLETISEFDQQIQDLIRDVKLAKRDLESKSHRTATGLRTVRLLD